MVFKGFNISYPSYTVITPQTGDRYSVRCLTVSEINELRHSQLTNAKASTIINDLLWKVITEKPSHINTYESFLKNTTMIDRTALVYAVYSSTFGNDKEFIVTCDKCSAEQKIKFQLDKIFSIQPYPYSETFINSYKTFRAIENNVDPFMEAVIAEQKKNGYVPSTTETTPIVNKPKVYEQGQLFELMGEENIKYVEDEVPVVNNTVANTVTNVAVEQSTVQNILSVKLELELPVSKIMAVIKQPTLYDEESALRDNPYADMKTITILSETLVLEKLYQINSNGSIMEAIYRDEIITGYNSLPIDDKSKIFEKYRESFGKYGIDLSTRWNCRSCGNENRMDLDIVGQFFRVVSTL